MRKLQLVFGTQGDIPSPTAQSDAERARAYRDFVRGQMKQDKFYENVIGLIINSDQRSEDPVFPFTLTKGKVGSRDAYYLGESACKESELVQVMPWWDSKKPVWVCANSYHPEIMSDRRAGLDQFCEATHNHNLPPICRCGAFLLNCSPDYAYDAKFKQVWHDEYLRTIQYVVQAGRPFSDSLTMNETVRGDLGDFFYARNRYYETGHFDYSKPDERRPATLKPRSSKYGASMFAGVLTTPRARYIEAGPRNIVNTVWREFLCTDAFSASVDAHVLWNLGTTDSNLRQNDHLALTTTPGCKDCHARLEYGMRSFGAWVTTRYGQRILDLKPAGTTSRFYVHNADDFRAEGPANPQWAAQTLSKQPELNTCMTHKVEKIFFGDSPVPPGIHDQLLVDFRSDQNMARLIENAVVARYVGSGWTTTPAAATAGD